MHPRFQNSNVDDPVLLEVGGKQGGSDTPELWKRIADAASRNARKRWVSEKLGILLRFEHPRKDDRVTHLYWADDFYMFAQSASEAARMFVILAGEVHKLHLTWKPSSLHAMNINSNIALGDWDIPVGDHDWTIRVGSKLIVLGVCIDSNACSSASFHHRLGQTIAHFVGRSKVLCNRRIPLRPASHDSTRPAPVLCFTVVAHGPSQMPCLRKLLLVSAASCVVCWPARNPLKSHGSIICRA